MNSIKIEKLFLIISLFVGLLLVFIVPPFQSPDENTHFLKAYEISKGKFYPEQIGKDIGYTESDEILQYIQDKESYASNRAKKYTYEEMYYEQLVGINYSGKYSTITAVNVTPIAHLIPALGIQLTDYIKPFDGVGEVGVAVKLQSARIMSLLFYSIICYFAIKITPRYKKSFFAILLLPNALLLRSMVSYDGLVLSVSALAIAYILDLYYGKTKFETKHMILFMFIGYILLNVKVVYFLMLGGLLFIPVTKFKSKKDKWMTYLKIILLILFFIVVFKIPNLFLNSQANEMQNLQTAYIMQHPFNTSLIIIKNIIGQLSIQLYWLFGTYGLLDTYMPVLFVKINELLLILILIFDASKYEKNETVLFRVLYVLIFGIIIFGMYLAMYKGWTPIVLNTIGGNIVTGVQGRYYIPLLLMIPIIIGNNILIKFKEKRVIKYIDKAGTIILDNIVYMVLFNLILSLLIIVLRFYA
ncbi:MAG: DUF2142 domain-containing protein [Bacilli bacterium]|nr:DUF2142 domain-containing protein [Bacilli bacterium]